MSWRYSRVPRSGCLRFSSTQDGATRTSTIDTAFTFSKRWTTSRSFERAILLDTAVHHHCNITFESHWFHIYTRTITLHVDEVVQNLPMLASLLKTLAKNWSTMKPIIGVRSTMPMMGGNKFLNKFKYGSVTCLSMVHG